jgi:Gas vesicle protein
MTAMAMTQMPQATGGRLSGELYKVVELILDRGLVIDVFVRVSLVGLEVVTIDARVVVASVDTYLRFAEMCGRIDLTGSSSRIGGSLAGGALPPALPAPAGQMAAGPARMEVVVAQRKGDD